LCQYIISKNSEPILAAIAHNVPAVYDVFAVAIKETVGFQQPQKCGGEKPHKGQRPTAVFRSPSRLLAAKHIQPVMRRPAVFHYFLMAFTTSFNLMPIQLLQDH
jgi:hypothetical protein